jgi:hypothetical protein
MGKELNLLLAESAVKYVNDVMSRGKGSYNQDFSAAKVIQKSDQYQKIMRNMPEQSVTVRNMGQEITRAPQNPFMSQETFDRTRMEVLKSAMAELSPDKIKAKRDEIKKDVEYQRGAYTEICNRVAHPIFREILFARMVELSGLGNCGEQSRVAFSYLVRKRAEGIAIVDWGAPREALTTPKGAKVQHGNHTFVVIGMLSTVGDKSYASLNKAPHWGTDAVICDPWYHEWFPVEGDQFRWRSKMAQIVNATLGISPADPGVKSSKKIASISSPSKDIKSLSGYELWTEVEWEFKTLAYLPNVSESQVQMANSVMSLDDLRALLGI